MIDIHAHILPTIDDGPETMEDSIFMAKIAVESGVDIIFATPHCNQNGIFDNYYDIEFEQLYVNLQLKLMEENIPITILPGMEIYGTEEVPDLLRKGKVITLNHSRYILLEFSFRKDISLMEYLIDEIIDLGYLPIIAHPERYPYIQSAPDLLFKLIRQGCFLQVNKGSILGNFGYRARELSLFLLQQEMVSFIASDAHSHLHRTTDMSIIYDVIRSRYSEEYAALLMKGNPSCIVKNTEVNKMKMLGKQIYFT